MILKLTRNSDFDRLFKSLKVGDVFTFSSSFSLREVEGLAKNRNLRVEYCGYMTVEYTKYGSNTVKVIETNVDWPFYDKMKEYLRNCSLDVNVMTGHDMDGGYVKVGVSFTTPDGEVILKSEERDDIRDTLV